MPSLGQVSAHAVKAAINVSMPMNTPRYDSIVTAIGYDVAAARNAIVADVLAATTRGGDRVSHLFWIDDDVIVSESALTQLYYRNLPMVSGYYYAKTTPPQPLILPEKHGGVRMTFPPDTLLPVYAHGMGCTLIRREVFDAIEPPWFTTTIDERIETDGQVEHFTSTEDAAFCERAAAAGFQPMVDTGVFAFHWHQAELRAYPVEAWAEHRARRSWRIPGHEVAA